jgi:hypothetical protein
MYSGPLSKSLRPKEIFFACTGRMPILKTQNEAMQFDEAPGEGSAVFSA